MSRISLLLAMVIGTATAQELSPEQYIADGAVRVFYAGCLGHYPDQAAFDDWVASNHFDPIPAEHAQGLIREPGGKAYSVNNNGVRYALVAEASNLCTVFVKEVNLEYARAALAKARKRLVEKGLEESSAVNKKKLDKGQLTTTEYQYKEKSGDVVWRLVISESTSTEGFFQLAMSATGKQRANNRFQPTVPPPAGRRDGG